MTVPRTALVVFALLALASGAWWEAVGIAALVMVLVVFWPDGTAQRPEPFRVWWGGGWRS